MNQVFAFATAVMLLAPATLAHAVKFDRHRQGTLKEIGPDRVVLDTAYKKQITLMISNITIVHRNGTDAHLDQLRVGDRILAEVMPNDDGTLYAVMLRATAPRPKKKGGRPSSVPAVPQR
jgi:hypothetical protein